MQVLKMSTTTTASLNGAASMTIPRKTRIRCVLFDLSGVGGAASGRMTVELSKQNTSNIGTSNTVDTSLASASVGMGITTYAHSCVSFPCDIPVDALNILYLNSVLAGTAPTQALHAVYLLID